MRHAGKRAASSSDEERRPRKRGAPPLPSSSMFACLIDIKATEPRIYIHLTSKEYEKTMYFHVFKCLGHAGYTCIHSCWFAVLVYQDRKVKIKPALKKQQNLKSEAIIQAYQGTETMINGLATHILFLEHFSNTVVKQFPSFSVSPL